MKEAIHLEASNQRLPSAPPLWYQSADPVTRYALLLLILSIAGFLRLYRFTSLPPGLCHDEAMNGSNALEVLETGRFQVFYPENGGREGLYIDVAAVCIRFWGNQVWVLRLPAAVFGILTVWGVYLLAAELASAEFALLAAFFLATSFWHVNFSRIAFRAIAAPLFLTWALYFLLAGIRRFRQCRPYAGVALLAGVVYGLGFYTYIAYRATPLLVAAVLLWGARNTGRLKALFAAPATLATGPLMLYFLRHPGTFLGRTSQVSVFHTPHPAWELARNLWRTGRMFFTRGDVNWRHNIAWRAELFWPVAMLFVLGVALGQLECTRANPWPPTGGAGRETAGAGVAGRGGGGGSPIRRGCAPRPASDPDDSTRLPAGGSRRLSSVWLAGTEGTTHLASGSQYGLPHGAQLRALPHLLRPVGEESKRSSGVRGSRRAGGHAD